MFRSAPLLPLVWLALPLFALAQSPADATSQASSAAAPPSSPVPEGHSWIARYQARVTATQSEQPHWVTPLVTVTPRLEQELRTDFLRQKQTSNRTTLWNYGNGKGLELIPFRRVELIFNVPPYLQHNSAAKDGFGDVSFLLKYRFFARNEEHGNAILTGFVGGTYPTGSYLNGARDASVTPTLAGGKGFGRFDVQSTLGATLPTRNGNEVGRPIAWNTTVQYHQDAHWWPEIEDNATWYKGGANDGRMQNFVTPGVVSRWKLHKRVGVTLGAGLQIATSEFHTYNHGLVCTARMPF
jgi:hypothetical protein